MIKTTLLAAALVLLLALAALVTPASAADDGDYVALHECKQVVRHWEARNKRNRVWSEELAWIMGYVAGAEWHSRRTMPNVDLFNDYDPVPYIIQICKDLKVRATLMDATKIYLKAAFEDIEQKTQKETSK
jgi:hypothetical protein